MEGSRDWFESLKRDVSFELGDADLYRRALTHSSFTNETGAGTLDSNQRLEFLGDAVLQLVISAHIYRSYPELTEGELTRLRAAVVCEPSLARRARALNLGRHLLLGRGEETTGGRERPSALADAFEALAGAIFLDRGVEAARQFVMRELGPAVQGAAREEHLGDYKTALQEWAQRAPGGRLSYEVVAERGPDHDKSFVVAVKLGGRVLGEGEGRSKKEAEQKAAEVALSRINP